MNTWANTVLTDKGRALMAKLTQGNTLNITRAVAGAGFVTPGTLVKETDVTDPKQELTFRPVSYPETGKCAITVTLRNDGLKTGYTATQVGLFATDPDEGEILLFISQATDENHGDDIPSDTEMPGFSSEWTFYLQYEQADGVSVTVDPSNAVTRKEMEGYVTSEIADDISMNGHRIKNVAEPTHRSDAATRGFVEDFSIEGSTYVAVDENKDGNIVLRPYVPDVDDFAVESTKYPGCYYRTTKDGEIEWINPPMKVAEINKTGQAYRTTKRHKGKVVYAVAVPIDVPSNSKGYTPYDNYPDIKGKMTEIVGYTATMGVRSIPARWYEQTTECVIDIMVATYGISTTSSGVDATSATVTIEYTKD